MNDLHFDSVGWPQEPLPVRKDDTTLFPRLVRTERRLDVLEANRKWQENNRELYLEGARERMRRLRAEKKSQPGVAP